MTDAIVNVPIGANARSEMGAPPRGDSAQRGRSSIAAGQQRQQQQPEGAVAPGEGQATPLPGDNGSTVLARQLPYLAQPEPQDVPRAQVHGIRIQAVLAAVCAVAAGASVSTLLFGWFANFTTGLAWVVVTMILSMVLYAVLVSFDGDSQQVKDKTMSALLYFCAGLMLLTLAFIITYTLVSGFQPMLHWNFFVQDMAEAGPLDPLTVGGISHAIVGTLIQMAIALAITIPLGIATAVYLNEVGGPFARFVRTITEAMTALPAIVAGLFVYAAFVLTVFRERNGLAAALSITVIMLPIVIRSADVVLRLVPGNLREASYALGVSHWGTVWNVVLPTAKSGLVTSVILGTAHGVGDAAPVLLTSGVTAAMNVDPLHGGMMSLPLQVLEAVKSPEPAMISRGFGTAAVLMILVLILFATARAIGGRGAGVLSAKQLVKAHEKSLKVMQRIEGESGVQSNQAVGIGEGQ